MSKGDFILQPFAQAEGDPGSSRREKEQRPFGDRHSLGGQVIRSDLGEDPEAPTISP